VLHTHIKATAATVWLNVLLTRVHTVWYTAAAYLPAVLVTVPVIHEWPLYTTFYIQSCIAVAGWVWKMNELDRIHNTHTLKYICFIVLQFS